MAYNSPFLDPSQQVSKIKGLSSEAISIDDSVGRAVREAKDFAAKYAGHFALVSVLNDDLQKFELRWTKSLQDTRDAASTLAGWLKRFSGVFLDLINDVHSQGDVEDVVTEFKSLLDEGSPLAKYSLDDAPGPKKAFQDVEDSVYKDSNHIVSVLHDSEDWQKAINELKQNLSAVQHGVGRVAEALEVYASKLAH